LIADFNSRPIRSLTPLCETLRRNTVQFSKTTFRSPGFSSHKWLDLYFTIFFIYCQWSALFYNA